MTDLWTHPLLTSIAGAALGAVLTWLLPALWKPPQRKRLEEVQKASIDNAFQSSVFRSASGEQRNDIINYVAASTSANSEYIVTGQGAPIVPDVQRWLQAATSEPRPTTRFENEVGLSQAANREVEVFYPAPFLGRPSLKLTPIDGTAKYRVEQRPDGFKVHVVDVSAISSKGVFLKWSAEGELSQLPRPS